MEENEVKEYGLDKKEVRSLISRALHKLANIEKSIVKLPLDGGKGYNYALNDWFSKNGKLLEKHKV